MQVHDGIPLHDDGSDTHVGVFRESQNCAPVHVLEPQAVAPASAPLDVDGSAIGLPTLPAVQCMRDTARTNNAAPLAMVLLMAQLYLKKAGSRTSCYARRETP